MKAKDLKMVEKSIKSKRGKKGKNNFFSMLLEYVVFYG
jgi:hypothetical protein